MITLPDCKYSFTATGTYDSSVKPPNTFWKSPILVICIGVYAGPLGVYSLGPVTSLTLVTSPLAQFGIMNAVLMSDIINKGIYNTHIHNSPKGPTSPPLTPFFGV